MTAVQFAIWLDGRQLPRKLVLSGHDNKSTLTVTMLVTSMNRPVSSQLPPASAVHPA
jgi:hypothetical protein